MASEEPFEPSTAAADIERVERKVRSSRRWTVAGVVLLGVATIAYFAVLGATAHKSTGAVLVGLVAFPSLLFGVLRAMRNRRPPAAGRQLLHLERTFGAAYVLLLIPAGIAAVLLPRPLPAALMGVVPAIPCLIGAWRAARG